MLQYVCKGIVSMAMCFYFPIKSFKQTKMKKKINQKLLQYFQILRDVENIVY